MPSNTQINARRTNALKIIDAALGTNAAELSERDLNIKVMKQMEMIADALQQSPVTPESDDTPSDKPLDEMSKDELTAEAEARGIYDDIVGTGANGNILVENLISALEADGYGD